MSDADGGDAPGRGRTRAAQRRTDGDIGGLKPGKRRNEVIHRIRAAGRVHSMIVFNWFGVCLIPILALIVLQIRRMAHRTPIFSYAMLGCAAGGPTLFLVANVCWLLAAFRPERSPGLTQLLNDFGWITFTILVPFLIGQSVILALAIYFDDQPRPVFGRWVAYFNLLVAAALVPAAFVGVSLTGPLAWDGFLSFWVKNAAIAVWIVVMGVVLARALYRERAENHGPAGELVGA